MDLYNHPDRIGTLPRERCVHLVQLWRQPGSLITSVLVHMCNAVTDRLIICCSSARSRRVLRMPAAKHSGTPNITFWAD